VFEIFTGIGLSRQGVFTCVIPYGKWHSVAVRWCLPLCGL